MYGLSQLWSDLGADIARSGAKSADFNAPSASLVRRTGTLLTPSLLSILIYRHSHWLHQKGCFRLGALLARLNLMVHRIQIDPAVRIGPGLYIPHTVGVILECNAGRNLTVYAAALAPRRGCSPPSGELDRPEIGDDVTIGAYAIVDGPHRIGNDVRISPQAVVTVSIPPGRVVVTSLLLSRSASIRSISAAFFE